MQLMVLAVSFVLMAGSPFVTSTAASPQAAPPTPPVQNSDNVSTISHINAAGAVSPTANSRGPQSGELALVTSLDPASLAAQRDSYLATQREAIEDNLTAKRIDIYLAGSPMEGMGQEMTRLAREMGHPKAAYLCAAVAEAESSKAVAGCEPWGMQGCSNLDLSSACRRWFDNLLAHPSWSPYETGYDIQRTPEYCESHGTTDYAENVTGLVNSIAAYEVSP